MALLLVEFLLALYPASSTAHAFSPPVEEPAKDGRQTGSTAPGDAPVPDDDKPVSAPEPSKEKSDKKKAEEKPEYYGVYAPGRGFTLAKTEHGEANFSLYFLVRHHNQIADNDTFTDHLGNERRISPNPRNDIQVNRVLAMFSGWIYNPKFRYFTYVWSSGANLGRENQVLIAGNLSYRFSDAFNLFAGVGPMPGVRSNQNVWPYFIGTDRRMADEFMRPAFTTGIWVAGNPLPRFYYQVMMGNNLSLLGVDASQLDRRYSYSGAVWWMPTTGEFGPRGSMSDYEIHEKLATRFGLGFTFSPEDRQSQPDPLSAGENTVIRLSDGIVAFDEGALAPGVTVSRLDYRLLSINAGIKYRGFALSGEYFARWLDNFHADGPLPVRSVIDHAFQLQTSYQVWPKTIEIYGAASTVLGQFNNSWEAAGGVNWFPFDTRNVRINGELIHVNRSPTGSLYTPYLVGQTGRIVMANLELFF